MNTLILKATVGDHSKKNTYNICFISYQIAQFLSMICSKFFFINKLELMPGLQIILLIFMIFISFNSKYI